MVEAGPRLRYGHTRHDKNIGMLAVVAICVVGLLIVLKSMSKTTVSNQEFKPEKQAGEGGKALVQPPAGEGAKPSVSESELPIDATSCRAPTGFLAGIVGAWSEGKKRGVVDVDGLKLDMGIGDGAFYDVNRNGCCDTYCRRLSNGGYWSCVGPQSVATQYEAMTPTGDKCSAFGRRKG